MRRAEPPDEYYQALGKIVATSAGLELAVLELGLAIELGSEPRDALIEYLPDYSAPGRVIRYAERLARTVPDLDLRTAVQEYLDRVGVLLQERHASTHGIAHSWIGLDRDEQGKAVETRGWMIFDAKTKSMREMSLDQMGDLADSLIDAEAEGRTLRDIIAPPPDRTALRVLVSEILRRRTAGEDAADLEAQLPNVEIPRAAPRHDWHFRGSEG